MKTTAVIFYALLGFCSWTFAKTAPEKISANEPKKSEPLLPMYSLVKEKGHTQMECTAFSKLIAQASREKESASGELKFSCKRNENSLLPTCEIQEVKEMKLEASNKRVLETTLSRALLFYFSKNRVEALAAAVKTADGWVTTPKNKRNIVQINAEMTELKMPEINVTAVLAKMEGFLFLKEMRSADDKGQNTTTTAYIKAGDVYYPSSIQAQAVFKKMSHLDVRFDISNCTSK